MVISSISCGSNKVPETKTDTLGLDNTSIDTTQSNAIDTTTVQPSPQLSDLDLSKIKEGSKLYFGEVCEQKCDYIMVEFIDSNQVILTNNHVWEVNGNSGHFRTEIASGKYKIEYLPQNAIETDNSSWPVYDSVIVLTNMDYGFDNGYPYLEKKYAIAKCKNYDLNIIQEPSIYEWLDPINYPSRNGEFSWIGKKSLTQLQ